MRTRRILGLLGLLAAAGALAAARDDTPGVGTKPGDMIPATFRAFVVVDERYPLKKAPAVKPEDRDPRDRTNTMHCLVCENGLSPVVAIFVRADAKGLDASSGVGKLAQAVNKLIPDYRADKLAGFVMFLKTEGVAPDFEGKNISTALKNSDGTKTTVDVAYGKAEKSVVITEPKGEKSQTDLNFEYPDDEKRDEYAAAIRAFAGGVKAPNVPFCLAPMKSRTIAAWEIADTDEVTVVIYNRMRVAKRWTFKADGPTDAQIKEIIDATEEMITGEKKTP